MKKKKNRQNRADVLKMSLWSRVYAVVIYYAVFFLLFHFLFWHFFDLKTVFRALDIITTSASNEVELDTAARYVLIFKAALVLASFVLCVRSLIMFYGVLLNVYRVKKTEDMLAGVASSAAVEGPQGVGKTRMQIYTGMLKASAKLPDLLYKYYLDCPVANDLNGAKKTRFERRKEAVAFYFSEDKNTDGGTNAENKIPLLYSNIKVRYNGREPYELKREHFTMEERLYESNVKILSETDNVLPNTMRKKSRDKRDEDKANDVDEFVGLDRQYTDGTLLTDTHDNGSIYKSVRDCQQCVYSLLRSDYVYTPLVFKALYERQRERVLKKEEKISKFDRKVALLLEKLVKIIGFTKIQYVKQDGAEGVLKKNRELMILVLPNQVPYSYDDRDLQQNYNPGVKPQKKADKTAKTGTTPDKTTTNTGERKPPQNTTEKRLKNADTNVK